MFELNGWIQSLETQINPTICPTCGGTLITGPDGKARCQFHPLSVN